jgi:hypothetical protein
MVTDLYEGLLQELGKAIGIPDLHPDANNSCLIQLPKKPPIQIEIDKNKQSIFLGCTIGVVPAGAYRENVFREALKANGQPQPLIGIFAFSKKSDSLLLFHVLDIKDLNGEKIARVITPFVEKAQIWRDTIARSEIPSGTAAFLSRSSGMFGLKE